MSKPSINGFFNYKFGTVWQYLIAIIIFFSIGYVFGVLKAYDYIVLNNNIKDVPAILEFYNRIGE